jgi:hypothetical protein
MQPPAMPGYELLHRVCATTGGAIYRARPSNSAAPVLLKLPVPNPSPAQFACFQREYELVQQLHLPGVLRPLAFINTPNLAIVLEDVPGRAIDSVLSELSMDLKSSMRVACQLASTLTGLHSTGVVHRDLRPANILVDLEHQNVWLADLSVATCGQQEPVPPGATPSQTDWAYISPEQTGRVNVPVDHRSDLYSLGVILYRLLTGKLPLQASDPLEWVHRHVAQLPTPVTEVVPQIPSVLSDVVMKLLAKRPEDRYQSALGVESDLSQCLAQLEETGSIVPFALAAHDAVALEIPNKLYGREAELATLMDTFAGASGFGGPKLALISGYIGIGKSSLAREMGNLIVRGGGRFIEGKFDQYEREIPYAAFTHALRELVQQILAGDEEEIARSKHRLQQELGGLGQIIVEFVPQLGLIQGPQPLCPRCRRARR